MVGVVKPVPVHEVALVELQVRVEDWPAAMDAGEVVSVAVGGAAEPTVTVTDDCAMTTPSQRMAWTFKVSEPADTATDAEMEQDPDE